MSRKVSCKYKRKAIVDKLCDVTKRPDDVKRCNVSKCSTYQWHAEEWNPVSRKIVMSYPVKIYTLPLLVLSYMWGRSAKSKSFLP